jgi:hypothetical protein
MFSYSKWLDLPLATRVKLAEIFGITKTGATEVASNHVIKDGYAIKDLEEKLTPEAMQEYLGAVDGEDANLFDLVIEEVMYVPPAPVVAQEIITKTTITETIVKPVEQASVVEEAEPVEATKDAEVKKSSKK